jgi:hypothetical protein
MGWLLRAAGCGGTSGMTRSVSEACAVSGLETVAIALGTAVAKAACGVWLGDQRFAGEIGSGVVDLVAQRMTSAREQRRFRRLWDQAAELVADRVEPLVRHEFRGLPEHERLAAVDAVRSTFEAAVLTEAALFDQDLDAGFLDRHLRSQDPDGHYGAPMLALVDGRYPTAAGEAAVTAGVAWFTVLRRHRRAE